MASNPVPTNPVADPTTDISTADKLKQALKTVTDTALFIEQMLAATGVGDATGAEKLTTAFGNLAAVAIQAAHTAAGTEITPESVMALMPVSTPLVATPEA